MEDAHEYERLLIAGLLQNGPSAYTDIEGKLKPEHFSNPIEHRNIFAEILKSIDEKDFFDATTISHRLKNTGISHITGISIKEYLESISAVTRVKIKAVPKYAEKIFELNQIKAAQRKLGEISDFIEKSKNVPYDELTSSIDAKFSDIEFGYFKDEQRGKPIMDGIIDEIEYRRENPVDEIGYHSGFKKFHDIYGGFEEGELYTLCARPGIGKSTWLMHLGADLAFKYQIPCLILDTEMRPKQLTYRLIASLSGIPIADLRHGCGKNGQPWTSEQTQKWEELKKTLSGKDNKYKLIHHEQAGEDTIDQIVSFVKRWRLRTVGRNNPCFIIYDYIKKTGEQGGKYDAEWQIIGDKTQKLKLLAEELNMPILTAVQANRKQEEANKEYVDDNIDTATIGLSDRILHLSAWCASLVEKNQKLRILDNSPIDQFGQYAKDWGRHKLIVHKARHLGWDWQTHSNPVLRTFPSGVEKHVRNYLNYKIENFEVEETGTLADILEFQKERHSVSDENPDDGDIL
jgi:replicative DNA helicase